MNFKTFDADIPILIEGVTPFKEFVEVGKFADRLKIFAGNRSGA